MPPRLLLIGNGADCHVGGHLVRAAKSLGLEYRLLEIERASQGPRLLRALAWRCLGRRPLRLGRFSREVLSACREFRPRWLLSTGIAPVSQEALVEIGKLGVARLNFLTDDPWNPAHRAPWFLKALRHYDRICSPRRSNLDDLRGMTGGQVVYLPFAYCPEVHHAEAPPPDVTTGLAVDLLFVGGADRDRVPWMTAIVENGLRLALYGGYWQHHRQLRPFHRGHADLATLRRVTSAARICVCLVRRANRDGHVMRSFEIPAMRGCMLTEDTEEHRAILGEEGDCTVYFNDIREMIQKTRWLLDHPQERARLAEAAHQRIIGGRNTYQDRLATMLEVAGMRT